MMARKIQGQEAAKEDDAWGTPSEVKDVKNRLLVFQKSLQVNRFANHLSVQNGLCHIDNETAIAFFA